MSNDPLCLETTRLGFPLPEPPAAQLLRSLSPTPTLSHSPALPPRWGAPFPPLPWAPLMRLLLFDPNNTALRVCVCLRVSLCTPHSPITDGHLGRSRISAAVNTGEGLHTLKHWREGRRKQAETGRSASLRSWRLCWQTAAPPKAISRLAAAPPRFQWHANGTRKSSLTYWDHHGTRGLSSLGPADLPLPSRMEEGSVSCPSGICSVRSLGLAPPICSHREARQQHPGNGGSRPACRASPIGLQTHAGQPSLPCSTPPSAGLAGGGLASAGGQLYLPVTVPPPATGPALPPHGLSSVREERGATGYTRSVLHALSPGRQSFMRGLHPL